jgi:hypothetical protein
MASILEVTAAQIHSIGSPSLLVDLLRKLLHAEARSNGIARRGISVPAQITVSDDGEDGSIIWQGGPDSTDYFPARTSMFQSKATDMPRQKCADEVKDAHGTLKLAIRQTLTAGGAYIVFSTDKTTRTLEFRRGCGALATAFVMLPITNFQTRSSTFMVQIKLAIGSTNIPQLQHGP